MVAPNRSAAYVRELDLLGKKLGFDRESSLYDVASENELHQNLAKFFLELKGFPLHVVTDHRPNP